MPGQTVDEIKYIVFRSLLLELFTHCPSCHNVCAGEVAYVQGIFIEQQCSHCEHQRQWTSQPHIKDIPAGNILLSAAILFSGATLGKVLRMLNHMKVACFTDRTFYLPSKTIPSAGSNISMGDKAVSTVSTL